MTKKSKTAEIRMPDNVPMLSALDIVWNFSSDFGQHDLIMWLELTFDPGPAMVSPPERRLADKILCEVLTERLGAKVRCLVRFAEFSHKKKISKEWLAAAWNEMLHRLDYKVPKHKRRDPGL